MFFASLKIRKQLSCTRGCVGFASIIAGPREFWTITVWNSRHEMLEFMRSGAHEDIMWDFSKWLKSFWLMRWRPTPDELGAWNGQRLAAPKALPPPPVASTPEARAALESTLQALPHLAAAVGPSGAPSYDYSPAARRRRQAVVGGVGATMRIEVDHVWQVARAWRDLASLRRSMRSNPDVLRWAIGVSRPREVYALAVLREERACKAFFQEPSQEKLRGRWGDRYWTMRWQPDNEFGQWDGLRLRRERAKSAIAVPEAADAAARGEDFRAGVWGRRKQR